MKGRNLLLILAIGAVLVAATSFLAYRIKARLLDSSRAPSKTRTIEAPPNVPVVEPSPPPTEVEPANVDPPVTSPPEGYGRRGGRGGKDPPPEKPPQEIK